MAINAYTGLMGSGKSYEVVENVILPALLAGRRVVTNVANLQQDDIAAYLVEKFNAEFSKLGQIVQVSNDDIPRPDFFPAESLPGQLIADSIVKPGDLVVLDEVWRWWSAGEKIPAYHMTFFRMHRHFIHPATGVSCDLVLVVQDIGDLDRKLKVVVENTYRMHKHKALGSTKRYRVDIFGGYQTRRSPIRQLQRTYNPEIFKLYQSYSQGGGKGGKEVAVDDRSNIFKSPLFRVVLPVMLLLLAFSGWRLWSFSPPADAEPSEQPVAAQEAAKTPPPKPSSTVSAEWRLAGYYATRGGYMFLLSDGTGRFRYLVNPPNFKLQGPSISVVTDEGVFTTYSGPTKSAGFLGEQP